MATGGSDINWFARTFAAAESEKVRQEGLTPRA
jgi:hypothetical protein